MPVATTTESKLRRSGVLKYELLLLMASIIWGSTIVAQQIGMAKGLGPMTFNGLRFALGCFVLVPVIIWRRNTAGRARAKGKLPWTGSAAAGVLLFGAAGFQQVGLQYTSSANSGFITGSYILFVPLIGTFFGHKARRSLWGAIMVCLVGVCLILNQTLSGPAMVGCGLILCGVLIAQMAPTDDARKRIARAITAAEEKTGVLRLIRQLSLKDFIVKSSASGDSSNNTKKETA